ncbi:MAG: DUF4038 domain-containing protein [Opitutaceae bacterium]|nr:DUF4038 domain-containing protein [Opitutaceae bacterium]
MTQPSEIKRRDFLKYAGMALAASSLAGAAFAASGERVEQNKVFEKSFRASAPYRDPFNDVEFKVRITFPDGREQTYPGYWAGGDVFKFRFSSHELGEFSYVTLSSNPSDAGLHQQRGTFRVVRYEGDNALLKHGPIRVSADKRHFTHLDGTPFLWLGDTWWCGLAKRLRWPDEFKLMTKDRAEKGFNAIQFTVGLAPTGTYFDRKNENENGLPWDEAAQRINPAYFDAADLRVFHLVDSGLVPVVVPTWGFYILRMGTVNAKKLWQYVMARWGALPAVWCLAGEISMPYYTSATPAEDGPRQIAAWSEVLAHLREINCYGHMISAHPKFGTSARAEVENPALLDFDMIQSGHIFMQALPRALTLLRQSRSAAPAMPVLMDEVAYEGIAETNWEDAQRQLFWASVLSGSPGFTYGAHGITQFSSDEFPSNVQPQGLSWGEDTWQNAYQYRGSTQVGIGRKALAELEWWRMEPHPEWVLPAKSENMKAFTSYAAGVPGRLRVIYFSALSAMELTVLGLEPEVSYEAYFIVPSNGKRLPVGTVRGNREGVWSVTRTRKHDLVLVMVAT